MRLGQSCQEFLFILQEVLNCMFTWSEQLLTTFRLYITLRVKLVSMSFFCLLFIHMLFVVTPPITDLLVVARQYYVHVYVVAVAVAVVHVWYVCVCVCVCV